MSMRLESDHSALLTRFPQGRLGQRDYGGIKVWCVDRSTEEGYTGTATWRRVDSHWIEVSFPGSTIRIVSGNKRFSVDPDWTEARISTCDNIDDEWDLGLRCGPSLLPKTTAGESFTCPPASSPRPADSAGR